MTPVLQIMQSENKKLQFAIFIFDQKIEKCIRKCYSYL